MKNVIAAFVSSWLQVRGAGGGRREDEPARVFQGASLQTRREFHEHRAIWPAVADHGAQTQPHSRRSVWHHLGEDRVRCFLPSGDAQKQSVSWMFFSNSSPPIADVMWNILRAPTVTAGLQPRRASPAAARPPNVPRRPAPVATPPPTGPPAAQVPAMAATSQGPAARPTVWTTVSTNWCFSADAAARQSTYR